MSRLLLIALLFIVGSVRSQTHQLLCSSTVPVIGGEATVTCQYIPGATPALTTSTTFPLRFSITITNAYIPISTAQQKDSITLEFKHGDNYKTFTYVAFATDQQISFSVTDNTGSNLFPSPPTIAAVTPTKRQIQITPTQIFVRPGETSRPITVRLLDSAGNSLAHSGQSTYGNTQTTLSLSVVITSGNALSLTSSTPTLTFSHGQTIQTFTVSAGSGSNLLGTTGTVQVGLNTGSALYNMGANTTSFICVPANGPGPAVANGYTLPGIPGSGSVSLAAGMSSAPWYLFIDYMSPGAGAEISPDAVSVPVGGTDVVVTPDSITNKWTFSQGGQTVMWQRFSVTPSLTPTNVGVLNFFSAPNWPSVPLSVVTLFNGANAPAPATAGFPAALSFAVRARDYNIMTPTGGLQIGDTFNVGVSLQQPLDAGVSIVFNVDCPQLLFNVAGAWVSNGQITLSSGSTGAVIRARAQYPGSSSLSFSMDPMSTGIYLFRRNTKTQGISVGRPTVVIGDLPSVQYTGVDSQAVRIYLTGPVSSSLTAVPYHPHCAANPSTITFTGASQWARFTLRCLTTVTYAAGSTPVAAADNRLQVFLAGPDRYNFNVPTPSPSSYVAVDPSPLDLNSATGTYNVARGVRRGSVSLFAEDNTLSGIAIMRDKAISIFTNRAPDTSLTVSFYSTQGATVTPATVTLTASQPNAIVHLNSPYPASGQIGMVLSGPDAHHYDAPGPVAWSSSPRTVRVDRICTAAEIDAGFACGAVNSTIGVGSVPIVLNAGDSFLTTFNFTASHPTQNGLTISISNPNLIINPNPVTIPAGQQTAQFTVQTGVGGVHELYFSYSGAPDMYIYNSPVASTTSSPVTVSQATVGKTGTSFPANSGIQTIVPAVLISLLVMLLALF